MSDQQLHDNISVYHATIDARLSAIDKALTEIDEKVAYTNGKVRNFDKWKSFMTGGLSVLTVLVVPVLLFAIKDLL